MIYELVLNVLGTDDLMERLKYFQTSAIDSFDICDAADMALRKNIQIINKNNINAFLGSFDNILTDCDG